MDAYLDGLARYFNFGGRSSRSQYWQFLLINLLLVVIGVMADMALGTHGPGRIEGIFTLVVTVFNFVPQISLSVRRLHDIGKSGWWYLLYFVPLAGLLVLVWACFGSEPGPNDYGDEPGNGPQADVPPAPSGSTRVVGSAREMTAQAAARRAGFGRRVAP